MLNDRNIRQYIKDNEGSGDYLLRDKGEGDFIDKWDMDIPKPTEEQLIYAGEIADQEEVERKAYKPSDTEILLHALESKAGITQTDKDASRQALIDAKEES